MLTRTGLKGQARPSGWRVRRAALLLGLLPAGLAPAAPGEWRQLFNGKDLSGWDTYVGPPRKALNSDPEGVFTVSEIDGAGAIHVSGELYGSLMTREEFENYHVRVEFRWGPKKWPPRETVARDSGLLYNSVGPYGVGSDAWMCSVECNIMERGTGQWWSVAGSLSDVEGVPLTPELEPVVPYKKEGAGEDIIVFRRGAPLVTPKLWSGITPRVDPERPYGEWNVVEVISLGTRSIHIVNGVVVLALVNHRVRDEKGKEVFLTRGKIQLQSEAAEVFYRKVEIRQIDAVPPEHRAIFPVEDELGFEALFDPDRLQDWAQCGPGAFRVDEGVATGLGGMGLWWYRGKQYGDFILRGEFLQERESDSGIFLRFPAPGHDPWNAVVQGHEVEIGEPHPSRDSTGAIYPFQGPTELPLRPDGEWNDYEIRCVGKRYRVTLNGKLINDYEDSAGRPLRGYIGLQNYPYPGKVRHRNLRIKEIAPGR